MVRSANRINADLYYCISYYQVYIAVIKSLLSQKDNVLILSDAIPDVENLQKKINKSNIFVNTYILFEKDQVAFSRTKFRQEYNRHGNLVKFLIGKSLWLKSQKAIISHAKSVLLIDVRKFQDIYVFGEGRSFAPYLHNIRKKFILVEDALNYYQRRKEDDLIEINRMSKPRKFYLVNKLLDVLGLYYYMGGYSSAVKKIEVNDKSNLVFVKCAARKLTELNRKELTNQLTEEQRKLIFDTFMGDEEVSICSSDSCVVFTNPLVFDKLVDGEIQAKKIYAELIKRHCPEKNIYIKPHPRDSVDYSELVIEGKNIVQIQALLPSEIFMFNRELRFERALALSSTAIDQATFARERINLGMNEFKKIKKEIL